MPSCGTAPVKSTPSSPDAAARTRAQLRAVADQDGADVVRARALAAA